MSALQHTQPEKVQQTDACGLLGEHNGIGFTVVNFNTSALTVRCVASLAAAANPPEWVLVLDNGSSASDFEALKVGLKTSLSCAVYVYRSHVNLGFAAGTNFLVNQLLSMPSCSHVGLLNNDAIAKPSLITELQGALSAAPQRSGLAGGRMHKLADELQPDTLGIAIYASLMPADRHSVVDTYLGPTGGCCLLTIECVKDIVNTTGYFFDERYFCYCEDTDLVLRANLLGYEPAYTDTLVALHQGQASSSAQRDDFIAYHGWRNVIWMHVKLMPTSVLIRHSLWLVLAHLLSIGRHLSSGKISLLWRVYRDAFKLLPSILRERKMLQPLWRLPRQQLERRIDARFYRKGYLAAAMKQFMRTSASS